MSTQDNINEIAKIIQKAMTAQEAASRGLVPQSGNPDKPGRWIKDPKAEEKTGEQFTGGASAKSIDSLKENSSKAAEIAHEGYENLSDEARELHITSDSMPELSNRRNAITRNLKSKLDKGTYESGKAVKLAAYLIDDANKQYKKDFGHSFSPAERKEVAIQWVKDFEVEASYGNYD